MWKNYMKVALRNLSRNRLHSVINIVGLSAGMAVALLIGLWIWDELSFDRANPNYEHIAQVVQNLKANGQWATSSGVPSPLADVLRREYGSDFKQVVMGYFGGSKVLSLGEKQYNENGAFMESGAPELMGLHMVKGATDALDAPDGLLLSESTARAYFGDADPLNQVLKGVDGQSMRVTGVYQDIPENSTFAGINFIGAWQLLYDDWGMKDRQDPWRMNAFTILVRLQGHADLARVSAKIRNAKLMNVTGQARAAEPRLFLYPMSRWHLYSEFENGVNTGGQITYVWLFGVIGALVLLLACINFMNLSTARAFRRAKEVGIRKAMGSLRGQLVAQFFTESLSMVFGAFVLSILLAWLMLPFFNDIAAKQIALPWPNPLFWAAGLGFCVITGMIAGSYPAFYLSAFRPVKVLKGTSKAGRLAVLPRKVLIVLQFSVSAVLMIGTLVVYRQIGFAKDRPIGYDVNGLVMMRMRASDVHKHFDAVKDELLKSGVVTDAAEGESYTTDIGAGSGNFDWRGKDPSLATFFPTTAVSYGYGKTVGWQFVEGRDFAKGFAADSAAFVINEAAAKYMGLKHPVGETIHWFGRPYKVIGVVKDIIVESPYDPVQPFFYYLYPDYAKNYVIARINPRVSTTDALREIKAVFKEYSPSMMFDYAFADTEYGKKFMDEQRFGELAGCFGLLAIFISCLGLFGMASFMAEQRVKEVGIRKVLGASVFGLWQLLCKDFAQLVLIALIIATPVGYFAAFRWLRHYAIHTGITWWIFAVTWAAALFITLLTVSFQSLRAALANPVKSLRSE